MPRNGDQAMGLQVWGPLLRANLYAIVTAPTLAFYHGDPVQHGGTSLNTKFGYMPIIEDGDIVADGDTLLGAVVGVFSEKMDPLSYMAVGRVGAGGVAGFLMIADHPDQEFIIQEDADTTPIPLTSSEMNADLEAPALNAGDTGTGISKCEIDSSTAATTASLQVKLRRPHLEDTVPATATYHTRWIVTINGHALADNIIGKVTQT